MRRLLVLPLCAVALAAAGSAGAQAPTPTPAPNRPNVLMILVDDSGSIYFHTMIQKLRRELQGFGATDLPDAQLTQVGKDEKAMHEDRIPGTETKKPCRPLPTNEQRPDPDDRDLLLTSDCAICDPTSPLHDVASLPGSVDVDVCTPNLDRLAREGVMFPHAYTSGAQCENARQSLWTGLLQRDLGEKGRKWGCEGGGWETLPETLSREGYVTYYAGKMHLGTNDYNKLFCAPESDHDETIGESTGLEPIKSFLIDYPHRGQFGDDPWFVVWAPKTPHYGYAYPPEWGTPKPASAPPEDQQYKKGLYRKTALNVPDASTPQTNDFHIPGTQLGSDSSVRDYYRSITFVDARVGELIEFLEDLEFGVPAGKAPNPDYNPYPTSVAYDPDNPDHNRFSECPPESCTWPPPGDLYAGFRSNTLIIFLSDHPSAMQDSKGHFSENGFRNPIILNFRDPRTGVGPIPGLPRVDDTQIPTFDEDLVLAVDLYPTILDFTGSLYDGNGQPKRVWPDARSFKEQAMSLPSPSPAPRQHLLFNWRADGDVAAIKRGNLVKVYADTPEPKVTVRPKKIYDLSDPVECAMADCSPFERKNLIATLNKCDNAEEAATCQEVIPMLDCWVDKVEKRDKPATATSSVVDGGPNDCGTTTLVGSYQGYEAIRCDADPVTHSACLCGLDDRPTCCGVVGCPAE